MPTGVYKRNIKYLDRLKKQGFQNGNTNWNSGLPSEQQPNFKGGLCKNLKLYKKEYRKRIGVRGREKEAQIKYYKKNKEACGIRSKAYTKKWRKNNPLSVKAQNSKRRLLESDLNLETVQKVYEDNIKKYGTLTCYLCLKSISFGKDHLEHKTPLCKGGTNEYDNLGVACQKCNCKKHTKTEAEYREENLP